MDRTGDIAQLVPAQLNVAESGDSNDLGRIQDVDGRSYQGISHGHDRPRRVLVGWRGRLVARRGPDRLQPRHRPRSAPQPSRVAIDVANGDGGLADEIDAASAEAVKGLRAYGHSWPRLAPARHRPPGRSATLG
jgi:hypothetical protein